VKAMTDDDEDRRPLRDPNKNMLSDRRLAIDLVREIEELIEEEREGLEALHMYGAARGEVHMMQRYLDSGDLVEAYKCGYVIAMYIAKRVRVSRPKS
jgi:predicted hydrocarbon binding protein